MAANVNFKKPGKSKLYAEFIIDQKLIDTVISKTSNNEKFVFDLPVQVKDETGAIISEIIKTIYVRRK